MSGDQILFLIFATLTCGGALNVVLTQNVVRMAFGLVVSLGSVSALFFLLNADFVAATQLLIYVGGTVVLLIFGVMLTASGPYSRIKTSPGDLALSFSVGVAFLFMILATVASMDWDTNFTRLASGTTQYAPSKAASQGYYRPEVGNTTRPIGLALLGLRPDVDLETRRGKLSTGYLLPFEIASVHLLVVLVGAAYLARAKRRATQAESQTS